MPNDKREKELTEELLKHATEGSRWLFDLEPNFSRLLTYLYDNVYRNGYDEDADKAIDSLRKIIGNYSIDPFGKIVDICHSVLDGHMGWSTENDGQRVAQRLIDTFIDGALLWHIRIFRLDFIIEIPNFMPERSSFTQPICEGIENVYIIGERCRELLDELS